jgi:hypothetical protein
MSSREDVIREASALRDLGRQFVARADSLVTMAAALPAGAAADDDAWRCPVASCQVNLHGRRVGEHLRNVHGDEIYDAWIIRHPEHALEPVDAAP